MGHKVWLACLSVVLGLSAHAVRADVWDQGVTNDNTTATRNELLHGTTQLHDLAAQPGPTADQDWFKIGQPPYSSWEIVVDSLSANPGLQLNLDLIASDGTTVLQTSVGASGLGLGRSLGFMNSAASAVNNQYVRVRSSCTNCTANDVYQIRAFETTYAIARFNNTGTQSTTLIIENKSDRTISGTAAFWDPFGALLATMALGPPGGWLNAKISMVTHLTDIPGLVGQSGSITVANRGRMGDLSGKSVSVDTGTGFTFETPMEPRPR